MTFTTEARRTRRKERDPAKGLWVRLSGDMLKQNLQTCSLKRQAMDVSSRTPEGVPNRCPACGKRLTIEPSQPAGDAPCPHCGHLLWFTQEEIDDAMVIKFLPKDELQAADIERVAVQFIQEGKGPRLVLDLSGFNFFSSGALAMLIDLRMRVKRASGSLRLCNLSPKMSELLTLTRLDEFLNVSEPYSEAKRRWYQFTLRGLLLAVVLASLLASYVGCYYRLSRRGMREAAECEMDGFLYLPVDEVVATEDLTRHHRRAVFFAPANWVDRCLFGGPVPATDILFHLS